MQTFEVDQTVEVTIASLAHGGSGVGRLDNFVFFIPFTTPGDFVRARVTTLKKNYADAELLEILTPSPQRITPPCPVFGTCGGCQWQHVSYPEQLKQKQNIVEHALSRIAKEENVNILPIIGSENEFYYRNRVQFRSEGPRVGFYKRQSHELVEFKECLISEGPINEDLRRIKEEFKTPIPIKLQKPKSIFQTPNSPVDPPSTAPTTGVTEKKRGSPK